MQDRRLRLPSCAAAAAEQPNGQSEQEATKRCRLCGNERALFYFPLRTSHPDGWVDCYACQREQRQKLKPVSGCAMKLLSVAGRAALTL